MDKGFSLRLPTSPSISMISRPCSMGRTTMSTSMEISDWIKRKKQFNRSPNISANSSSATSIIHLNKISLQPLDKLSKYGRMNEQNPYINFNGTWIRYWKWSITLQILTYSVRPASIVQWFSTIWGAKLRFKRSHFPTNQCASLSIPSNRSTSQWETTTPIATHSTCERWTRQKSSTKITLELSQISITHPQVENLSLDLSIKL